MGKIVNKFDEDSFPRYDVVVNTAGLLAEDLCLALTKPDGRVVTALTQPPGLRSHSWLPFRVWIIFAKVLTKGLLYWLHVIREYGLVTGLVASSINFLCDIFRDNLWGGDRVIGIPTFVWFKDKSWVSIFLSKVWGSTKLRGEVLDYLGQLVLQVISCIPYLPYFLSFNLIRTGSNWPSWWADLQLGAVRDRLQRAGSRGTQGATHNMQHPICQTKYVVQDMQNVKPNMQCAFCNKLQGVFFNWCPP